jgi:WD40 repeat protein
MIGSTTPMEFSDFLPKIKEANNKNEQKEKCKQHENIGIKYCQDCELWLCDECINIHSIFNNNHILLEQVIPLKNKCQAHSNEFTQYYCLQCKEEVCPLCIIKGAKHEEHKNLKMEKFINLAEEIKSKLKYKTFDECEERFNVIREKVNDENNQKIERFKEKINNLIDAIKKAKDKYIKEINEKMEYLNNVIDIMKECYKHFYLILSNEKQDYNNLNFLRQVEEIVDIKSEYYNYDDISNATKIIENLNNNDIFHYNIQINEIPTQFSLNFNKIFYKKFRIKSSNLNSLTVQSKYNIQPVKYKEIKYEKSIKTKKGTIYNITKINNDEIAVACGNEILIIDINKKTNESEFLFNEYPSLIGHTKNVLCLSLLSENKLVSGSEDKSLKIWDITDKKCINTISSDFQRIDSILPLQDNIIILGTHNIIKIINIETKEEISSLIGHQKSICSIIRINNVLIASSSYDNSINIYNIQTNEFKFSLLGHDSPVFCILLLRDGRLISGSGSWNKSLKIWNLDKRKCECTLIGHKREVRDIKQLNNGWIITASNDKTIKVWDIHKKICIQTLISHYDIIFSLCIINKNKFACDRRDQDIILWKY